jgi:hypothetical protein
MRAFIFFLIVVLNASVRSSAAVVQNDTVAIEGVVIDDASQTPLYGVFIGVAHGTEKPKPGEWPYTSGTTDDAGRFRIVVPHGTYTVEARRDGYFGPKRNGIPLDGALKTIAVVPGQQLRDIVLHLTPAGAVTGRALDHLGFPRAGMTIAAMRMSYDNGRRIWTQVRTAQTDDRGEFRIYWIPPGEYVISALPKSPLITARQGESGRLAVRTFFPGTADGARASVVTVKPGADTSGINFALQTADTVNLQGRVVNPHALPLSPGAPSAGAYIPPPNITLTAAGEYMDASMSSFGSNATVAERDQGVFRILGVPRGSYEVFVADRGADPQVRSVFGRALIEVHAQDVTEIMVNVHLPVDVKGRFVMDGTAPFQKRPALQLRPIGDIPGVFRSAAPPKITAEANGEFTISKAPPGLYTLDIDLPEGVFVRDVLQGGQSVAAQTAIVIGHQTPEPMQILLSRMGGAIRGRIEPGPDAAVVLIPDTAFRASPLFYRTARPAEDGSFEINSIVPGRYKLFAWKSVLTTAWMNPEFIKQYEDRGMPIQVDLTEISGVTLTVLQ